MSQDSKKTSEFGALFEAHLGQLKTEFKIGDRVKGTVTAVDRNSVFVDIGARCDALIDRPELTDDQGQIKVKVGDVIEAFCVGNTDDGVRLTTRMSGAVADASLMEAYEGGIPVEGRVMAERKGGYEVQVASLSGFCPFSQMDTHRRDATAYIGERFTFVITEYDESGGGNLVLSRRRCLEQEQAKQREALRATLAEGALIDGVVTRLMPFGAFVDIGSGVEGLIHVSELGWGRGLKPEDVLAPGQAVKVSVTKLDWENQRIGLSLRHAQQDPWERLGSGSPYVEGRRCEGVVTKLMPFGAFVELEPGIEGLVHVSRLGAGRRINHPSEVLSEGQRVEVAILTVDRETRRLSLSMEATREERELEAPEQRPAPKLAVASAPPAGESVVKEPVVKEGARLAGTVEGHRDFGVFVKLPDGQTGLLHISQLGLQNAGNTGNAGNAGRALYRRFPPASTLEVVVLSVDGRRISLTLPETLEREAERLQVSDFTDRGGSALGSLDGVFGNLKLE
jgi:small subunit ribosomal protein S1